MWGCALSCVQNAGTLMDEGRVQRSSYWSSEYADLAVRSQSSGLTRELSTLSPCPV